MYFKRLLVSVIILLFISTSAFAKAHQVVGFDSRSAGLGGALAGESTGAEGVVYNPAGLGFVDSLEFSFTYLYSKPSLTFEPLENEHLNATLDAEPDEVDSSVLNDYYTIVYTNNIREQMIKDANDGVTNINGYNLGLAVPLETMAPALKGGTFGLGLYSYSFSNSLHLPMYNYDSPYYLNYSYRPLAMDINMGVGYDLGQITHWLKNLSVGISLNTFLSMYASLDAYMTNLAGMLDISNLSNFDVSSVSTPMRGYVDMPLVMTPIYGIQYKISDDIRVGLVYKEKFVENVDADAVIHLRSLTSAKDYAVPATIKMRIFYDPTQINFGASWKVINGLKIMAEVDYSKWSEYTYPFLGADLNIAGVNGLVGELTASFGLSASSVTLPQTVSIGLPEEQRVTLENTISPKIGIEYSPTKTITIDLGYYFDPSPVKRQDTITNLLAADTHAFSGSFFYKFSHNLSVGIHGQYQMLVSTTYYKDDKYFKDNDEIAGTYDYSKGIQSTNPGYPGYTVGGGYFNMGLTLQKSWGGKL